MNEEEKIRIYKICCNLNTLTIKYLYKVATLSIKLGKHKEFQKITQSTGNSLKIRKSRKLRNRFFISKKFLLTRVGGKEK